MRITLIHNPAAGERDTSKGELLEALRQAGFEPSYHSAKSLRGEALDKVLTDPGAIVVVAGGDGTVGKVARRLAGRDVSLAIIPAGTANNIATALGISGDAQTQAPRWVDGRRVPVEVGVAEGPWGQKQFIESVGCGLFAEGMARHSAQNGGEAPASREEALEGARKFLADSAEACPARVRVTLDGADHGGDYLLVEVMNIRSVGPNLVLAPDADPGDGFFDVVLVRESERGRLEQFLRRGEGDVPGTVHRARQVELSVAGCPIHIDDDAWPDSCEPGRQIGPISLTAGRDAVQILVP